MNNLLTRFLLRRYNFVPCSFARFPLARIPWLTAALVAAVFALPLQFAAAQTLTIGDVVIPEGPFLPGDTATIDVTVENNSGFDLPAGSSVVVTATVTVAAGGSFSSPVFNNAIEDGGSATLSINVPIGDSDDNGIFAVTLIELAWAGPSPGSADLSNPGSFTVEAFANLVISETIMPNVPLYPGSEFSVTVVIVNEGDRGADASSITGFVLAPPRGENFWLTDLATIESSMFVDFVPVPALAPNGATSVTLSGIIPLDNPNGTYEVRLTIDAQGDVPEGEGETDNIGEETFAIDTLPDLRITNLEYDIGSWVAGDFIDIRLEYENRPQVGAARTLRVEDIPGQGYYIEVVLSTDTIHGNEDDFLLHRRQIYGHPYSENRDYYNGPNREPFFSVNDVISSEQSSNLLPGDLVNYSWLQMIPANFAGDYYVLAKIDVDEAVTEYVEDDRTQQGNNVWTSFETAKITILPSSAPDATTERVSVRADGTEGDRLSDEPDVSTDGRYVVFSSLAQLDEADTNAFYDVYLKDNYTGDLTLVSRTLPTVGRGGDSRFPVISGDGNYVAFQSESARLDPSDTNQQTDIYRWERRTGILTRVSVPDGTVSAIANSASFSPSINDDGNLIAFASRATNMVAGGTAAGISQVYVRDLAAETTVLLSQTGGAAGTANSTEPTISKDGNFVAFTSLAPNLGAGATASQIFRVAIDGTGLTLISRADGAAGAVGTGHSFNPAISADGDVIAFASDATNLVGGDSNAVSDIFIREVAAATTARVVAADGSQANPLTEETTGTRGSIQPSISDDGNLITFRTQSDNLLPGTVTRSDGITVTLPAYGQNGYIPVADQLTALFPAAENAATDAIHGYSDLNAQHTYRSTPTSDIYLFNRDPGAGEAPIELISRNNFGYVAPAVVVDNEANTPSSRNARISGDGRYVVFANDGRGAVGMAHDRTNRISPDQNEVRDVFIRDRKTINQFQLNNPPAIAIDAIPGPLAVGQPVMITTDATDASPGFVVSVDFYINGQFVGTRTRGEFFYLWTPANPGDYRIDALATDNDGLRTAALPVTVTVENITAPSVSITSPANGANLFSTQPFTIHAMANDANGIVTEVEFFINGQSVGVDDAAPFSAAVAPQNPGTYYLHAVATNNSGYAGYSAPIAINVVNGGALTVTMTQPTTDLTLNAPTQLAATVTGTNVFVQSVVFYANGIAVGEGTFGNVDGTPAWTATYTPQWPGQAAIFAIATDSTGNAYMSGVLSSDVVAGNPPALANLLPAATPDLELNAPYTLSADVINNSPGTTLQAVEVILNGSISIPLELDVGTTYTAAWQPDQLGLVEAVFVARDSIGNLKSETIIYDVKAGDPPTVAVLNPDPLAGDLAIGVPVVLGASAVDTDGNVVSVEFSVNGISLGFGVLNFVTGLYELSWTPVSLGQFDVVATAIDNRGNVSISAGVTYQVALGDAPLVQNPSPDGLGNLTRGQEVTLSVQASDPDGTIAGVVASINGGAPLAMTETVTVGTYTANWTPVLLGNNVVVFTAVDNLGNQTSLSLTYNVVTGSAPVIAAIEPATGSSLPRGIPATLSLTATDPDGTVQAVTASINGGAPQAMAAGVAINGYSLAWTPQLAGANTVAFTATDNLGNITTESVTYNVVTGASPTVSIINPADGASYWTSQPFSLYALANDTDGNVVAVEFYANGQLLGAVNSAPYLLAIGPDNIAFGPGVYEITAVAEDNNGNRSLSAVVTARLIDPAAPSIAIASPLPADGPLTLDAESVFEITVTGADAPVSGVELLVNGVSVSDATVLNGVWYATYTPRTLDDFEVRARVTNSLGGVYDSGPLTYSTAQGAAPSVVMTGPGASLEIGEATEITATIADADGTIATVNVLVNGVVVGTAQPGQALGSYRFAYTPTQTGTFVFAMEAFDNLGNRGYDETSSLVTAGAAPTVAITAPDPTDSEPDGIADVALFINQPIDFRAAIADDGVIEQVSFSLNGAPLGPITFSAGVYSVPFTPAATGLYNLVVSATDNRGNTTTDSLSYTVEAGAAPTVVLTAPNPVEDLTLYEPVTLVATANDTDGNVVSVEFRIDGTSIGLGALNGATGAYELEWIPTGLGDFLIQVVATDNLGNIGTDQDSFRVVTGAAPQLTNILPADGSSLPNNLPVTLSLTATDPDGTIESVTAVINGGQALEMVQTGALNNYSVVWTPQLSGISTVVFSATDNLGNTTSLSVSYNVATGAAPTVGIVNPVDGARYWTSQPFTLYALANDTDGNVASVEFFANGQPIGTVGNAPYTLAIGPGNLAFGPGVYALTAVATDNNGNRTTSPTVTVELIDPAAPTIAITSPAAPGPLTLDQEAEFEIAVTGADAPVTLVELLINGESVSNATVLNGVWYAAYTPRTLDDFEVRARVTNSLGGVYDSAPLTYSTAQGAAPSVAMTGPAATLEIGEEAEIAATITDADGSIVSVNVLVNGVVVGTAEPGQALGTYRFAFTPAQTGTFTFAMEAFDNLGNRGYDETSSVVSAGVPPAVAIVAPDPTDAEPDGIADAALFINQEIFFRGEVISTNVISDASFQLNGVELLPVTFSAGVYSVPFTPAATGIYNLVFSVTDIRGNTSTDEIAYVVEAGQPPSVAIVTPNPLDADSDGIADQALTVYAPVRLAALADDPDGNVVSVEFRVDGTSLGLSTLNGVTGLHELEWIPTGLGLFLVEVIASDNLGNTQTDEVVYRVATGQAPSLQNAQPADGETLRVGSNYTLSVDATDPDGSIVSVTASINGGAPQAMTETVQIDTYTLAWTPSLLGLNHVLITAIDNSGNPTVLELNYPVVSGAVPTVDLVSPDPTDSDSDGTADVVLTIGAEYTIAANAGDADGEIVDVSVRINGGLPVAMTLGGGGPNTYSATWTPTAVGNYNLVVSVTDDSGNVSTAAMRYVVAAGAVPQLANIQPPDGSNLRVDIPVQLSLEASDADGQILSVTVAINNGTPQAMTESGFVGTYAFEWTPLLLGDNTLRFAATDNLGNTTVQTVVYTVVDGDAPVVAILSPDPADANSDGIADSALLRGNVYQLAATADDADGAITSVSVRINNGTPQVMTETDEVGRYAFDWVPALLGLHHVVVTAVDDLGNSVSEQITYNVITGSIPSVAIVAPSPADLDMDGFADTALLVGTAYDLTATANDPDGSIVSVTATINGGAAIEMVESGSVGTYIDEWTPNLTGDHVVVVTVEDDAGNRVSATVRYRVAYTGPTITQLDPANGSSLRRNEETELVMFANAGDAPIVSAVAIINGQQTLPLEQVGQLGRFVTPWTPTLSGLNSVVFTVTDAIGQTATALASYSVSDSVAPTIVSVSPAQSATLQRNIPQTLVANVTPGDGSIVSVTATINGNAELELVETGILGTYLVEWTPALQGNNMVAFRVVDSLGGVTIRTVSYNVIAESGPIITAINPSSGSSLQRNLPVELNVTAVAGDSLIESVTASINGRDLQEMVETYAVGTYTFEWTPALIGNNVVIFTVTDELGNVATQTAIYPVGDTAGPAIISTNPPNGTLFKRGIAQPISVSAVAGASPIETVTASINGRIELDMTEVLTVGTFSVDWTPALNGVNTIIFTVTDTLGNSAIRTVNYSVTEAAGPSIISLDPPDGASFVRQAVTVLSATVAPGDTPIVQVTASIPGAAPLTLEQTDEFGVYSVDWGSSFVGSYPVTYTVTDSLGKTAVRVAYYTVRKARGPSITGSSPASGTTLLRDVPTVVGAQVLVGDNPLASVTVRVNGGGEQTIDEIESVGNYGFEWTPTLLGDNVLSFTAVDTLGKVASYMAIYRVVAPGGPVISDIRPGSGTPLPRNLPVSLGAVVNAGDAPLVSVEARINRFTTVELLQLTEAGYYEFEWVPNLVGNNIVEFIATDALGNSTVATANYPVFPGVGPTVGFISPVNNSRYLPGTDLFVHVEAYDSDGLVTGVEFYLNGVLVGQMPQAPYMTSINLPASGVYSLGAVAIDNVGNRTAASPLTITAGLPDSRIPSVVLDHPLPLGGGDTVNDVSVASSMFLNATVTDDDGEIVEVRFYINGQLLGPAESSMGDVYSRFYKPNAPGIYYLTAAATDNEGNVGQSLPIALQVGPLQSPLPKAEIYQPFTESLLGRIIGIFVEVDAGLLTVDRVDFYANGVLIGSSEDAVTAAGDLFTFNWVPTQVGDFELRARVVQIDPGGNEIDNWVITGSRPVKVVDPGPGFEPTIAITSPRNGDQHTVLNPIVLQANALDPLGSVTEVRFYANGRLLDPVDSQFPYTISFTPSSPGQYQIVAEMISDRGIRVQSAPVMVNVGASELPTITIISPAEGSAITVGRPVLITATSTSGTGTGMELDFYVNGVFIGRSNQIPYRVSWTPQSTGTFAIRAQGIEPGTGGLATSPEVNVRVTPTAFPTASFVSPGEIDPTAGSDVLVQVEAEDSDGFVSFVEFYVNGEPLGATDTSEPFATFWRPLSAGTYELMALVVDNSGNSTIITREVQVGDPVGIVPRVTLSVTASGNVTPGSRVVVRANVFDDTPDELAVTFFMNGVQLAPADTTPPYSIIVDPQIGFANFYEITAVVADPDGNSRADSLSPLYISDVTVEQPSIDIISLAEGDELTLGSRAPIRVDVSGGAVPNIAAVVFYADGVEIGRDTAAPYSFDWVPQRAGDVQITAATLLRTEGYDHDGDPNTPPIAVTPVNVAAPVNVKVNAASGVLPSISLGIFPRSTQLAIGSKILLYADAQDLDGTVESVSFFVDGQLVAVDNTAPFTHTVTTTSEGVFAVNALATDDDGNVVTSSFISYNTTARVVTPTPVVQMTVPSSGQQGSILSLRASTQSFVSGPEAVVFHVNGQVVGQSVTAPYNFSWLSNLDGELAFFATAQQELADGSFVTTVSEVVTSTLLANQPPVIETVDVSFTDMDPVNKPNPLIGEAITFLVGVFDTGPVERVELLRDGEVVAVSASASSPYELVDTPPGLGTYQYSIVVTDRGGLQTQSSSIAVQVAKGLSPVVNVITPSSGSSFILNPTIDSLIEFSATASDADGFITELVFLVNGRAVGPVFTEAPYQFDYQPNVGGGFTVAARATDNSGNVTTSSAVAFTVIEVPGTFPQILSFTTSAASRQVFVGEPILFTVEVTDTDVIGGVELLSADEVVAVDTTAPYQLSYTASLPGIYSFSVRATNLTGNATITEPIQITVMQPMPLVYPEDFVFQAFVDLFLRAPTSAELDAFTSRLSSGELSRDRLLFELLDPNNALNAAAYAPVRSAILAHRMLLGEWVNRDVLEQDVSVIRASGLPAFISDIMPLVQAEYVEKVASLVLVPPLVDVTKVPDNLSSPEERATYISYLFMLKYGVLPTPQQLSLAQLQFLSSGRDAFTANFIADVRVIATGTSYFTGGLGFQFAGSTPPSDRYLREANAASLILNLLRITPTDEDVAALADLLFASQVANVLDDPRYAARFITPFEDLQHHVAGWKSSSWFGWFNTSTEPWYFHAELGWVQFDIVGQDSSNFWFYDELLEWTYSNRDWYPLMYVANENSWFFMHMIPYQGPGQRWFFSYAADQWVTR